MQVRLFIAMAVLTLLGASGARAGCCDVVNASDQSLAAVRICQMPPQGGCEVVLFEGPLAPGEAVNVCSETGSIVYDQPDDSPDGYGEPTGAECEGTEVQL